VSTAARLRVDFVRDDDRWGFVVPALHIVGGGPTRQGARSRAVEAIAFALEAADDAGGDAEYLEVVVG
jgi:hypothetical protein